MSRVTVAVVAISTAVLLWAAASSSSGAADFTARQNQVARHGADVMPFRLSATTHIFTKTADGGIQQVVTKHHDTKEAVLIREHLSVIAHQFSAGKFDAPEQIHGNDMPGLAALRTAEPGELTVDYRDLPDGGEIVYHAQEQRLVSALHEWFDAQFSDHGHDAVAGHNQGMMHHHPTEASATD